ncbi:MAG: FKBP-type peptidyl-prolyl cis-trans isomerase [Desulfuromonadales bacterium]|nr:FKBP-type peptidyl-prolyl cis-trans isomerase [Desulfuromonadales bacterium]
MKMRITVMTMIVGLLLSVGCVAEEKEKKIELNDLNDKFSYSYGLTLGQNFKLQEMDVDLDIFLKGLKDGIGGAEPMMTAEEIQQTKTEIQEEITAKAKARTEARAAKNKQEGEAFLAENASKEGVVTTESGLQYKIIEEGTGPKPSVVDKVTVHYKGTLVDGTEFDSSERRGMPATFPVGGVIPGWTEALQLMNEGAKWQLFIPSALAYGERGAGPVIEPNSVLIFDVELVKVGGEEEAAVAGEKSAKE